MKHNITYKDDTGKIIGLLKNKFNELDYDNHYALELELDGVIFQGDAFDGLELKNETEYNQDQLNRYSFNDIKVFGTEEKLKELTNCTFQFEFQIKLADKHSLTLKEVIGIFTVALGNYNSKNNSIFTFNFSINNTNLEVTGDSFEEIFDNLKETIKDLFYIKNCYGCKYSDYSPYGRDSFGDMMCFKNAKTKYLNVTGKADLFKLMSEEKIIHVQETHLCDEFEVRKENTGYRG